MADRATPYRVQPLGSCSRCGQFVYPPHILTHSCGANGYPDDGLYDPDEESNDE